jgi:hypothetical protein
LSGLIRDEEKDLVENAARQVASLEEAVLNDFAHTDCQSIVQTDLSWLYSSRAALVRLRDIQIEIGNTNSNKYSESLTPDIHVHMDKHIAVIHAAPYAWIEAINRLELSEDAQQRATVHLAENNWCASMTAMHLKSHCAIASAHLTLKLSVEATKVIPNVTVNLSKAWEVALSVRDALCSYGNRGYSIADSVEAVATAQTISLDCSGGGENFLDKMTKDLYEVEREIAGQTLVSDRIMLALRSSDRPREILQAGMLRVAHGAVSVNMQDTIARLEGLANDDPHVPWSRLAQIDANWCLNVLHALHAESGVVPFCGTPPEGYEGHDCYVCVALRDGKIPSIKHPDYDCSHWMYVTLPKTFNIALKTPLAKFLDDKSCMVDYDEICQLLPLEIKRQYSRGQCNKRMLLEFCRHEDITMRSVMKFAEGFEYDLSKACSKLVAKATFLTASPRAFSVDTIKIRMYLVICESLLKKHVLPLFKFMKMDVAGPKLTAMLLRLGKHQDRMYRHCFQLDASKWCSCYHAQLFILSDIRLNQMSGSEFFSLSTMYMSMAGFISIDRYNVPLDSIDGLPTEEWRAEEGSFCLRYGRMFEGKMQKKASVWYGCMIQSAMDPFQTAYDMLTAGDNVYVLEENWISGDDDMDVGTWLHLNKTTLEENAANVMESLQRVFEEVKFKLKTDESWSVVDFVAFLKQMLHLGFNLGDEAKKLVGLLAPCDSAPGSLKQRIQGVYSGGNSFMNSTTHIGAGRHVQHVAALTMLLDRVELGSEENPVLFLKMFLLSGFATDSPVPCVFDQLIGGFPDKRTQLVEFWKRAAKLCVDADETCARACHFAMYVRKGDGKQKLSLLMENTYSTAYERPPSPEAFLEKMVTKWMQGRQNNSMISSMLDAVDCYPQYVRTLANIMYNKVRPIDCHLGAQLMKLGPLREAKESMSKWLESGSLCQSARIALPDDEQRLTVMTKMSDDHILFLCKSAMQSDPSRGFLNICHRKIVDDIWLDTHMLHGIEHLQTTIPSPFSCFVTFDSDCSETISANWIECLYDPCPQNERASAENIDYIGRHMPVSGVSRKLQVQDRELEDTEAPQSRIAAMDLEVLKHAYCKIHSLFLPKLFCAMQKGLTNMPEDVLNATSGHLPHSILAHKPLTHYGNPIYANYNTQGTKFVVSSDNMTFSHCEEDEDVLCPHSGVLAASTVIGSHRVLSANLNCQEGFSIKMFMTCECCIKPIKSTNLSMLSPLTDEEDQMLSMSVIGYFDDYMGDDHDEELYNVSEYPAPNLRTASSAASSLAELCVAASSKGYQDVGNYATGGQPVQATRAETNAVSPEDVLDAIRFIKLREIRNVILDEAAVNSTSSAMVVLNQNCSAAVIEYASLLLRCNASSLISPHILDRSGGDQVTTTQGIAKALNLMIRLSLKKFPKSYPVFAKSTDAIRSLMKNHLHFCALTYATSYTSEIRESVNKEARVMNDKVAIEDLSASFDIAITRLSSQGLIPEHSRFTFKLRTCKPGSDIRSYYVDSARKVSEITEKRTINISRATVFSVYSAEERLFAMDAPLLYDEDWKTIWSLRLFNAASTSGPKLMLESIKMDADFRSSMCTCEHPGDFASLVSAMDQCQSLSMVSEFRSTDAPQNLCKKLPACMEVMPKRAKDKINPLFRGLLTTDLSTQACVSLIISRQTQGSISFFSADPDVRKGECNKTRRLYSNIASVVDHVLAVNGQFIIKVYIGNPCNSSLYDGLTNAGRVFRINASILSSPWSAEVFVVSSTDDSQADWGIMEEEALLRKERIKRLSIQGVSMSPDVIAVNNMASKVHASNLDSALARVHTSLVGEHNIRNWVKLLSDLTIHQQLMVTRRFKAGSHTESATRARFYTHEAKMSLRLMFRALIISEVARNPNAYLENPPAFIASHMGKEVICSDPFRVSMGETYGKFEFDRLKDCWGLRKVLAQIAGHSLQGSLHDS